MNERAGCGPSGRPAWFEPAGVGKAAQQAAEGIAHRYLHSCCHTPDLDRDPSRVVLSPAPDELTELIDQAPPMQGLEYLRNGVVVHLGIASLVELLQGKLSAGVRETIIRPREGLFPSPKEISLTCSCPEESSGSSRRGTGTRRKPPLDSKQ